MKTLEQPNKQGDEMLNLLENKESLQPVIEILKETAEQFQVLDSEANILLTQKDASGFGEKLQERARLLVNLPDRLTDVLGGVDAKITKLVLDRISGFAFMAQEALATRGTFALSVLLTHKGDKPGDKNDLEKFIEVLEKK